MNGLDFAQGVLFLSLANRLRFPYYLQLELCLVACNIAISPSLLDVVIVSVLAPLSN